MLQAEVILPVAEHFPDPYDGTDETVDLLFQRVCGYMQVDESRIDLEIFGDQSHELRTALPFWSGRGGGGPAGVYFSDADQSHFVVAVSSSKLKNPLAVVATVAHELAHVILLGGNLVARDAADMEPLTDLATVFLGLGVFTANASVQFEQHQDVRTQGWSVQTLGYLSQEMFGYSLARFAMERGENRPKWMKHLSTNVAVYCRDSSRWLSQSPRN